MATTVIAGIVSIPDRNLDYSGVIRFRRKSTFFGIINDFSEHWCIVKGNILFQYYGPKPSNRVLGIYLLERFTATIIHNNVSNLHCLVIDFDGSSNEHLVLGFTSQIERDNFFASLQKLMNNKKNKKKYRDESEIISPLEQMLFHIGIEIRASDSNDLMKFDSISCQLYKLNSQSIWTRIDSTNDITEDAKRIIFLRRLVINGLHVRHKINIDYKMQKNTFSSSIEFAAAEWNMNNGEGMFLYSLNSQLDILLDIEQLKLQNTWINPYVKFFNYVDDNELIVLKQFLWEHDFTVLCPLLLTESRIQNLMELSETILHLREIIPKTNTKLHQSINLTGKHLNRLRNHLLTSVSNIRDLGPITHRISKNKTPIKYQCLPLNLSCHQFVVEKRLSDDPNQHQMLNSVLEGPICFTTFGAPCSHLMGFRKGTGSLFQCNESTEGKALSMIDNTLSVYAAVSSTYQDLCNSFNQLAEVHELEEVINLHIKLSSILANAETFVSMIMLDVMRIISDNSRSNQSSLEIISNYTGVQLSYLVKNIDDAKNAVLKLQRTKQNLSKDATLQIIYSDVHNLESICESIKGEVSILIRCKLVKLISESPNIDQLMLRLHTNFCQVLSGVLSALQSHMGIKLSDQKQANQLYSKGILLVFCYALSCIGDENGMLEDTAKSVEELKNVRLYFHNDDEAPKLRISSKLPITYVYMFIEIVLPEFQNKAFRLVPALFNVGFNQDALIAPRLGPKYDFEGGRMLLETMLNIKAFNVMHNYMSSCKINDHDLEKQFDTLENLVRNYKSANHSVTHLALEICPKLNGFNFIGCKSAKDRTAMVLTYHVVTILQVSYGLTDEKLKQNLLSILRSHGATLDLVQKNIGKRSYAFTATQQKSFPKVYCAPLSSIGANET
ncbi:hypothetical protein GJ496_000550 [Pomphorhynchus laevis]|nr:hypothetical protein GJ496_000550 [Pomphorhynchus laevis]